MSTLEKLPSVPAESSQGVSNAIITRKGQQGSRDQKALATPDYKYTNINSRR